MIEQLVVRHFTLFQKARFSFGEKLNIIIGENGNGKTQILKLLYALTKSAYSSRPGAYAARVNDVPAEAETSWTIARNLEKVFNVDLANLQSHGVHDAALSCRMDYVTERRQKSAIQFGHFWEQKFSTFDQSFSIYPHMLTHIPIYLPARELLSIYPHFLSLSERYNLPYDGTYQDTIKLLGLPYLNEVPKAFKRIVNLLEKKLRGEIYLDPQAGRF